MKKVLFIIAVLFAVNSFAQDVIFRTQKDSINAKIVTVSDEEITYRMADYDEGPLFSLKT